MLECKLQTENISGFDYHFISSAEQHKAYRRSSNEGRQDWSILSPNRDKGKYSFLYSAPLSVFQLPNTPKRKRTTKKTYLF